MSHYIPFAFGPSDCRMVSELYPDAPIVRLPANRATELIPLLPQSSRIWIDPLVDGFCQPFDKQDDKWKKHVKKYVNHELICDSSFIKKPQKLQIVEFVNSIMSACAREGVSYVTVPQLPVKNDTAHNKLNKELAAATRDWAQRNQFAVHFILPVVFTNQQQINKKTARNSRVKNAAASYELSGSTGYWIVDESLCDQAGSVTLRDRHSGIAAFHEELNAETNGPVLKIGGPYWGLNLVLWAKGLITHPAIGLGRGFQYFLSGGIQTTSKPRIMLQPLRRLVVAQLELRPWLDKALEKLSAESKEHKSFSWMRNQLNHLSTVKEAARRQVAQSYKEWYDHIEAASQSGRALTLYQDLSAAYVLGKSLNAVLPKSEAPARRPEQVAENLMMQCL